jgi:hypothetical protein
MAYRQIRVSDLTGEVIDDQNVVEVTIRSHPDLEEAKRFDSQPAELKGLKPLEGLVELELRTPTGTVGTMYLRQEDFDAVIPLEKVKAFDSTRGRRTGYKPNGS